MYNSLVLVLYLNIWYRFTVPFSETYEAILKKRIRILFRQEKTVSDVLLQVTQSERRPLPSKHKTLNQC